LRKFDIRCIDCFRRTYQRLFEKVAVNATMENEFWMYFEDIMRENYSLSSPEIQKLLNNKFNSCIQIYDAFLDEKKISNRIGLDLYFKWKEKLALSQNPFDLALRLAIAGNIMDYGANNNFDIHRTIATVINSNFYIDYSLQLKKAIKKAKSILYLGDNAGEIFFDKLFIETIKHKNISFAVRGAPILNDVTTDDAYEVGMNEVAKIISNGFDAAGTILNQCSKDFIDTYNSADIIISKGQGNFEGLIHENDQRIFFLLMIKCDVIAEILNAPKGSFVVYNKNN
jgi:hypothetical protein